MFERRLKLILGIFSVFVVILLLRAAQLQVVQAAQWRQEANDTLQHRRYTETNRGSILDRNGKVLARDRACTDACVLYYALTPQADEKWLNQKATERLQARLGDDWTRTPPPAKKKMREKEAPAVQRDIDAMWAKLAKLSGRSIDEIEQTRQFILQRVELQKKFIWYQSFLRATKGQGTSDTESLWQKWLSGQSDDAPPIDKFNVTVGEERQAHVILHDIPIELQNELGRHLDEFPGLVMMGGLRRYYPNEDVACHLLGHVGKVNRKDILNDPNHADPRRRYLPNDEIGRGGLEWLCEPSLRGVQGVSISSFANEISSEPPIPGNDVRTSIDVGLQHTIQRFFASATLRIRNPDRTITELHDQVLHGAAVVIDVKTNQVLALVSNPTYDLNRFDELYQSLSYNDIDEPLRNRATESQFEPGSTVKPLVGLAGVTEGVVKVNEGIECKGYLELPNHHGGVTKFGRTGRCWVASMYAEDLQGNVAHHPVPSPHKGHDGNADGWLTYSDGLERSCNVYFETVADRLGIERLTDWMHRFGLGRRTGIGIEEYHGYVPGGPRTNFSMQRRTAGFLAGIGQGYVAATPIQMANVAATIARDGIWMRPQLVIPDENGKPPALRPGIADGPDRVDLHLDPEAIKACKLGMVEVVNDPAGTGNAAYMEKILIAGKTGTAQGSSFRVPQRDPITHKPLRDEDGKTIYDTFEPSTREKPNPEVPWYRGSGRNDSQIDHAWMIGFAPADDPKVAFCVLVEYGGSGGGAAADVVRAALDSCIEHGYLKPRPMPTTQPLAQSSISQ